MNRLHISSPLFRLCFTVFSMWAWVGSDFVQPQTAFAQEKVLYLTFDDGPSELYTPKILDILRHDHIRATFFVLGFRCQQFPKITRRIHREGHEIGNHGFYHEQIVQKSDQWIRNDVLKTDRIIQHVCGIQPVYYRPPGGVMEMREVKELQKIGHPVVLWSVDSMDWKTSSAETILDNVKRGARPGSIILMHDGVSNSRYTIQALPALIHYYRAQGYVFKVLPMRRHHSITVRSNMDRVTRGSSAQIAEQALGWHQQFRN